MSDVVRQRLELLLAEVEPRRALSEVESGTGPVPAPGWAGNGSRDAGPPVGADGSAVATEGPSPGGPTAAGTARRVLPPVGGVVAGAGRWALEFSREHLAAVVLVLLVGCGWTAYTLLQAQSTPVAVAAPPSVVASPAPTPSSTPTILVHVIGAVRSPGVVTLPEGSRVTDAIGAAGGLAASADPEELNLAAVVGDGSQLVIGTRARPRGELRGVDDGGTAGTGAGGDEVSLNSATVEQLETLPGVGPVTASKIMAWRKEHGRFASVAELQEVDGIGPKTYAEIAPHVRL